MAAHKLREMASIVSFVMIASLFISYATCGTSQVKMVRGVELTHQPFYNPNQDFTCLDGSKTIPFSSVNDDYCDCADGTDEPGTAACPEGKYYCYNIGYKAKYIVSSRVNDGICDCCDGSDEYDSDVACFNECEKFGLEEQLLRKEAMAETIEGSRIRNEYIQSGKEKKETKKARIDTINGLLTERMQELEEAKASKESAETPEKEAKEKHDKEWDELQAKLKAEQDASERDAAFNLLDSDRDGWISIAELLSHNHMESDLTESEAKDLLGGEAMVDKDGLVNVWKNVKPKFMKFGRPDPSKFDESNVNDEKTEEAKEDKKDGEVEKAGELKDDISLKSDKSSMNEHEANDMKKILDEEDEDYDRDIYKSAEKHLPESGDDMDEDEDDEEDNDDSDDEDSHEESKDKAERPDYDDATKVLIAEADKARSHFETIDKSVRDLENEKKELEDYLAMDFGGNEEFSALKGQCYEYTDREYIYKLCPFERVTQKNKDGGGSETELGNKMSWKGTEPKRFSVMKYDGGQTCWNGPARSTTVHLSCGKANQITSVSEPSRCEYEMTFKTPALCDEVPQHDEL